MSKFKFTKKLLKYAALTSAGAGTGAWTTGAGHSRTEDTKKGLLTGALLGAGIVLAPKLLKSGIARAAGRGAVKNVKRQAMLTGKIVFRKIRGRLVPIKVKG